MADRRKMFELVASRVGGGALQHATSRPDLRQLQHDALADYVERKRGVKRDEGGQRSGRRPCSAYLQSENSNHTGGWREEGKKTSERWRFDRWTKDRWQVKHILRAAQIG